MFCSRWISTGFKPGSSWARQFPVPAPPSGCPQRQIKCAVIVFFFFFLSPQKSLTDIKAECGSPEGWEGWCWESLIVPLVEPPGRPGSLAANGRKPGRKHHLLTSHLILPNLFVCFFSHQLGFRCRVVVLRAEMHTSVFTSSQHVLFFFSIWKPVCTSK